MANRRYPSDLSDVEWRLLEPHLPPPRRRGRPRIHSPGEILNAVFYILKSGCQWRMLPRDFPPWKTVLHYFRAWRVDEIRADLKKAADIFREMVTWMDAHGEELKRLARG